MITHSGGQALDPATRRDRIEAGRVVLRRACDDDLAMFHAAMSDPGVMRYWSTPPHEDLATSRDWVAAMIAADPQISDDFVIRPTGCWQSLNTSSTRRVIRSSRSMGW